MSDDLVIDGVRLTNPDKILYPEQAISKRNLADYYCAVAEAALAHLARRPISLVRCPVGRQKKCFFQRHAGSGVPAQVRQIAIPGFEEPYLYIEDRAGLVALVQMGALEIHPWGCRTDRPDRPDRLIFDLDPGEGVGFDTVVEAAREMRERLGRIDLESAVKTTGGKGMHVVVPIERRYDWAEVKRFARSFAEDTAAAAPDRYLTRLAKAERRGRIFIDYLRNDPTSTAVAPYSTRNRLGAPVATPLHWSELTSDLDPAAFSLATVPDRVRKIGDPWAGIATMRNRLPRGR